VLWDTGGRNGLLWEKFFHITDVIGLSEVLHLFNGDTVGKRDYYLRERGLRKGSSRKARGWMLAGEIMRSR